MQSRRSILVSFAALAAAAPALAQTGGAPTASSLATMIATTGSVSLMQSRLANGKLQDAGEAGRIQRFAQAEIDEQEMLGREFARMGVQPLAPSAEDAALMQQLQGSANGMAFGKLYMQGQVKGHAKLEAEMVRAQGGSNAELAALATKALPLVREHLNIAQGVVASMA